MNSITPSAGLAMHVMKYFLKPLTVFTRFSYSPPVICHPNILLMSSLDHTSRGSLEMSEPDSNLTDTEIGQRSAKLKSRRDMSAYMSRPAGLTLLAASMSIMTPARLSVPKTGPPQISEMSLAAHCSTAGPSMLKQLQDMRIVSSAKSWGVMNLSMMKSEQNFKMLNPPAAMESSGASRTSG